jgi:hypothetical protein
MAMVVNAARFEALECRDIGTVITNAQKWADHENDHPMSSAGNNWDRRAPIARIDAPQVRTATGHIPIVRMGAQGSNRSRMDCRAATRGTLTAISSMNRVGVRRYSPTSIVVRLPLHSGCVMAFTRSLFLLSLFPVVAGCAVVVPPERSLYVGAWEGESAYLCIMREGYVIYERYRGRLFINSVEGRLNGFKGDNVEIGWGPIATTIVVDESPYWDGAAWRMVVDGKEVFRTGDCSLSP